MDSLAQTETATTARDAAVALTALLDLVSGEPEFDLLRTEVIWSVRGGNRQLSGRLYTYGIEKIDGLQLLDLWRWRFGGEVKPTKEKYTDDCFWHALSTEIDGFPVVLMAPVKRPDVEQQLRDRIAELGAVASTATEFRLTPTPPAYTPLIVRRNPGYDGTNWAVIHDPGDSAVRRAWTLGGWEMASVLAHEELYCWPDAETALAQAKQAQADAGEAR